MRKHSPRLTAFALFLAFALTLIPYPAAAASATLDRVPASVSASASDRVPAASELSPQKVAAPDTVPEFAPGYVPVERDFSYPDLDDLAELLDAESVPAAYDARDYGLIPPIRNQGSNGICWTFSSMAMLEANLLKNGYPETDFSEIHLAYSASSYNGNSVEGWNRDPGGGGTVDYAASYFMRGTGLNGVVLEENDRYGNEYSPLPNRSVDETRSKPKSYTVRNVMYMNEQTKPTPKLVLAIKQAILDYGAVAASMYWDGTAVAGYGNNTATYYNAETGSYYYNGRSMFTQNQLNANHAVTIIGWDDGYPRTNFNANCRPSSEGAWLVRNSWGEDWGVGGYVWISYEDTNFPLDVCFIDGETPFDPAVHIYETDYKTDYGYLAFQNVTEGTFVRSFTVEKAGEQLQSVKVYLPKAPCKAEIGVSQNFNSNSFRNYRFQPLTSLSVTWPGWHTIDFPSLLPLGDPGTSFAIVLRITSASAAPAAIGYDQYNAIPRGSTAYLLWNGSFQAVDYNFSIKAVATTNSAESGMEDAKNALTWDLIRGENDRQDEILWNLSLPQSLRGASVAWSAEPSGVIAANGSLTPPTADTAVTLFADISYGGVSERVTFALTVKGVSSGDKETVAAIADALTWDVIRGDNASASGVTSALSLPTEFQGASVSWTSSNEQVVTAGGDVYRPREGDGDASVTLKASLQYGTAAADKTFPLTVTQKAQVDDSRLDREMSLYDWYGAWEKVRGDNPAGYFGWENIRTDLVVPAPQYADRITLTPTLWSSGDGAYEYEFDNYPWDNQPWDCVAADGTVTRPAFGQPDSAGNLIIWFWLPGDEGPSDGYLYEGYKVLAYKGDIRITQQPENISVSVGSVSGFLRADAQQGAGEPGAIGSLSYQWYSDDDDTPGGGAPISGANEAAFYLPSDLDEGVYSCYCEISAPDAAPVLTQNALIFVEDASEKTSASVFFDSAGGSAVRSQSVAIGECASEPENPVRDGYVFNGWRLDGEPYDFSAPVTEDITLTAAWEPSESLLRGNAEIEWTVIYQMDGFEVFAYIDGSPSAVWCAVYDGDGKMAAYSVDPYVDEGYYYFAFDSDASYSYVKIFALDGDLRPLCECGQALAADWEGDWLNDDSDDPSDDSGDNDSNPSDDSGGGDWWDDNSGGGDWWNDNSGGGNWWDDNNSGGNWWDGDWFGGDWLDNFFGGGWF